MIFQRVPCCLACMASVQLCLTDPYRCHRWYATVYFDTQLSNLAEKEQACLQIVVDFLQNVHVQLHVDCKLFTAYICDKVAH